ncbi:gamma-glutamylcyclotransferase [Geothermobacter hydrogeniphilus]|uniref:Gamma-glutamylcyclotransferase n=1 Tax=Geothermobacter hydrogeniphilus TaxID=1969733 RepID=A0A2K2H8Q7_9BACT|nr:gamma-glutamylcyclotransferase family protein [Geothermobacter hydrogeniphilus]PNU19613.1 gamma-glutamylcyclotransferase [Geothermobacter hydrogeniphilus]
MLYFAYGSNMATARLRQRIPSAHRIGVARLDGYRLAFQVASTKDGSGKCDACPATASDQLFGVLFRIDPAAKTILDHYEGVGIEYRDTWLTVEPEQGNQVKALIYLGINIDRNLRPYPWYREHVLRGAIENQLPEDYIASIRAVPTMDDPDPERATRELSIYLN